MAFLPNGSEDNDSTAIKRDPKKLRPLSISNANNQICASAIIAPISNAAKDSIHHTQRLIIRGRKMGGHLCSRRCSRATGTALCRHTDAHPHPHAHLHPHAHAPPPRLTLTITTHRHLSSSLTTLTLAYTHTLFRRRTLCSRSVAQRSVSFPTLCPSVAS